MPFTVNPLHVFLGYLAFFLVKETVNNIRKFAELCWVPHPQDFLAPAFGGSLLHNFVAEAQWSLNKLWILWSTSLWGCAASLSTAGHGNDGNHRQFRSMTYPWKSADFPWHPMAMLVYSWVITTFLRLWRFSLQRVAVQSSWWPEFVGELRGWQDGA